MVRRCRGTGMVRSAFREKVLPKIATEFRERSAIPVIERVASNESNFVNYRRRRSAYVNVSIFRLDRARLRRARGANLLRASVPLSPFKP